MNLSIVTPVGSLVEAEVSEVTVPGAAGIFGVYPNHQPALVMLGGGELTYQGVEENGQVLIRGGVAEISGDTILIITDHAELPGDADREAAETILESAMQGPQDGEILDDIVLARITKDRAYAEAVLKTAGH